MQKFPVYPLQENHLGSKKNVQEETNELVFGLNFKDRFQSSLEKFRDV